MTFPDVVGLAAITQSGTTLSRAEKAFRDNGYLDIGYFFESRVSATLYEWVTFRLPGGTYTPDFMVILSDGRLVFIEVKESAYAKGYRDSRSKLRSAAALNPWFYFVMAVYGRKGNSWRMEVIPSNDKGFRNGIEIS